MKLLIANRGEIAIRIIRTCRELGITTVVGYCESERDAAYVNMADEAYLLGRDANVFIDSALILDIAKRACVQAVHPGYGFLSESPDLAAAVQAAGMKWIGPDPSVLYALGDKASAREIAARVAVPTVPGIELSQVNATDIETFAAKVGFPVVIKKVDGGGGRGIKVLRDLKQLHEYFQLHDGAVNPVVVEKFLEHARHLETQCVRDAEGNFAVISTRDCSLQRRNQKMLEEAPAFDLPAEINAQLIENSRRLFAAVDYIGVGTCEFLYEDNLYFLEVNPRLQVEHSVSEEVTGLDLVRMQLTVAMGTEIPPIPEVRGHAIEMRITSEDPGAMMMPTTGVVDAVSWPLGLGVRIDTGLCEGDAVTAEFDSMIAKIIVTAENRQQAIVRAQRVLRELKITGIKTPIAMYQAIFTEPDFVNGNFSTRWFEAEFFPQWNPGAGSERNGSDPNTDLPSADFEMQTFTIEIDGKRGTITVPKDLISAQRRHILPAQPLRRSKRLIHEDALQVSDGKVTSPIQALVLKVCTAIGAQVQEGDLLAVLESMKMESYVYAPCAGTVVDVSVADGENVVPGALIARIEELK
ncbi:acetyl/propionyl/methylcrotonyl-CoA carboxylase subunit alpha [Arcanobacterium hippocoleae]|uniref:acetyl/propionyl/methylcrotonyl-CoA carboxylase subunit alpha n=1 Tax=Arcanobacterium hippocoleae TaxID=149017 RepID=UPI003341CCC7